MRKNNRIAIRLFRSHLIYGCILLLLTGVLTGCGNQTTSSAPAEDTAVAADNTDTDSISDADEEDIPSQKSEASDSSGFVDLTQLSSTMVYSEVFNMMYTPEDYIGQKVKMNGTFAVYDEAEQNYYACVIADAAACCSQGIEFVWKGDHSYPEDYPEVGSDITVEGTFEAYEEDGYTYYHLANAEMVQ